LAQVQAVISGVGGLIKTNTGGLLMYASNSFNGPVQISQGSISVYQANALGSTNSNTTVAAGAILILLNSSVPVAEPIVLSGILSGNTVTLTGPVTLAGTNATIQVPAGESFNINGVISGDNGFTKTMTGTLTLNSNNTYTGTTTINGGLLRVQGSQPSAPIALNTGGLGGTGAVGDVTSGAGLNVIGPGASPGILTCSNVTLQSSTSMQVEIYGGTAGSGYDQLHARGTVALNNAILAINAIDFAMSGADQFIIIDNDGTNAINGTFTGLPEGATVNVGTNVLKITYVGGTGNDVVLYQGNPPSHLTAITSISNGAKQIQGMGLSNLTYTIQAVTNLTPPNTWSNLGPATADNSGVFSFVDTNAPLFPIRFYRAQSP
jgi:fibronectin-binding autotransporter adhesin